MEIIGAFEAKTRLSELLERTAEGETFEITKHGRPVGWLVPPNASRDRQVSAAAVMRLKAISGVGGAMSQADLKAMIHEGHRY